jgi:16S rRNA (guanine966-N2)-methyltransferase
MMTIRIISGEFGGRKIEAPDGRKTHPMGERIRNALFNKIIDDIDGAEVLDAFAGTGSLGIEALSRGARSATFIERDRTAQDIIVRNITLLGLQDKTKLVRASVSSWLETSEEKKFDLILVDPPYHDPQFSTVVRLMGLLKPGALMVLSQPGRSESPTRPGVVVVDNRSYGNATLTFYRREA